MNKRCLFLLLFLLLCAGCGKGKDTLQEPVTVGQEVTPTIGVQEPQATELQVTPTVEIQQKTVDSLDSYAAMIGMSKQEILSQLGDQYTTQPIGMAKLDEGYYFAAINTSFFFNADERLQYIEYDGSTKIQGKEVCNDFDSIMKEYGETELEKYITYDEGDLYDGMMQEMVYDSDKEIFYKLSYLMSDYLISFVSKEESGENYCIYIYKPVGFLSQDEMIDLLDYDTKQIQARFGKDCIISADYDELFPYWDYYQAIGLYFGVNLDHVEEDKFIQFAPWIEFSSVHSGMTLEEVQEILGDTLVIHEERYLMGYEVDTIEYREKNYFLSFDLDQNRTEATMQIAKPKEGFRDLIREDSRWIFHEDKLGFEYQGVEYIINDFGAGGAFPIYDSSNYPRYNMPDEALGGVYYCWGEWFYIAFDEQWNLNLYAQRFDDDGNETDYKVEQVLIDHEHRSDIPYEILDSTSTSPVQNEDITEEEKGIMNEITSTLDEGKLYSCFYMDSYDEYKMEWPQITKKSIKYDFNCDDKIEELQIRYFYGKEGKDSGAPYKDDVIELALGNQKVIIRRKPELYSDFQIGICDVDSTDDYIEIYTTDFAGCYGSSQLFRMEKGGLKIACDIYPEELKGVSGDGKVYVWNGCFREPSSEETYEDLLLWYYDYASGKQVTTKQMIGKQYISIGGDILFRKKEQAPDTHPVEISIESEGAFYEAERGEVCNVIDVDSWNQRIRVKTKDGKKGWIGGYHTVWH